MSAWRGAWAGTRGRSERLVRTAGRWFVLATVHSVHMVLDVGHLVEDFRADGTREGVACVDLLVA